MDLFYKPPLERFDECQALEDNYMNCMFQKALRDKVMNNRCNMDSILWFHLECPKHVSRFDNPVEFKRKVANYLAEVRTYRQAMVTETEESKKLENEYSFTAYPEDIKEHKELRQFKETFDHYSPVVRPDPAEEYEEEEPTEWDFEVDKKEAEYGNIPEVLKPKPITVADSAKHSKKK